MRLRWTAFVFSCLCFVWAGAAPAQPLPGTDVFRTGTDGYAVYRIPGLVVTAKGTLLAYAEARRTGGADWGAIDIVLKRSTDGGATWSAQRVIGHVPGTVTRNPVALSQSLGADGAITYNNPIAIADRNTGAVHFLFCIEYMRAFYLRSDDDGLSFTRPVELTPAFEAYRPGYDWKVIATGPGHGLQLDNGRLLVPVWLSLGTGGHAHRPSVASTIYSDDAGVTWKAGEIAVSHTEEFLNPSETVAEQLSDGRVMLNLRSESKRNRRLVVVSPDGATGWSAPRYQEELREPICFGSLVRLRDGSPGGEKRLLFVNPDNLLRGTAEGNPGQGRDRRNLTVHLSEDEGTTWPIKRVIDPGWAGYADINVSKDGAIYVLYERGEPGADRLRIAALTLVKFPLSWVNGVSQNASSANGLGPRRAIQ